jgi:hypothetical protein
VVAHQAKVAILDAVALGSAAGMVGLDVEEIAGITYLEVTVAIPLTEAEAGALADRLRRIGGRHRGGGAAAPPPRKRRARTA